MFDIRFRHTVQAKSLDTPSHPMQCKSVSKLLACTVYKLPYECDVISEDECENNFLRALFLVDSQQATDDDRLLQDLGAAATQVTKALNDLLQHVKQGTGSQRAVPLYDEACDRISMATDKLFSSVGNAGEMVKQAKLLAMVRFMMQTVYSVLAFSPQRYCQWF